MRLYIKNPKRTAWGPMQCSIIVMDYYYYWFLHEKYHDWQAAASVGIWYHDVPSWSLLCINLYFKKTEPYIIDWHAHSQIFNYALWQRHSISQTRSSCSFVFLPIAFHFFSCYFPVNIIHTCWFLPLPPMALNPSYGPFLMVFSCSSHTCPTLLLFLQYEHSHRSLSELFSLPDGH